MGVALKIIVSARLIRIGLRFRPLRLVALVARNL